MRTDVRISSLEAYDTLARSGKLGRQQQRIMDAIARRIRIDWTLQEISQMTGLPINVVSGRVNELKTVGCLTECERRRCSVTGRSVIPVRPTSPQRQLFE